MKRNLVFFLVAIAIALVAVLSTFYGPVEFSSFAAIGVNIVLGLASFYAYTRFVLADKVNFIAELKAGNVAVGLFLLSISLLVSAGVVSGQSPAHLDSALHYAAKPQPLELTLNAGPDIDRMLLSVNVTQPAPWCAAYVSYCLSAAGSVNEPLVRSASSRAFITRKSVSATLFLRGAYRPPAGTIAVWKNGETPFGHVGFVIRNATDNSLVTVEGNTSSGGQSTVKQREGDGAYIRRRLVMPGNYFRITHFTPVRYARSNRA